jgi:hypothetical protein
MYTSVSLGALHNTVYILSKSSENYEQQMGKKLKKESCIIT